MRLADYDKQTAFDKAYTTIRDRGFTRAGSEVDGHFVCTYRSPNGPCAIGALISDEEYKPEFDEDMMSGGTVSHKLGASSLMELFLDSLQEHHDTSFTPEQMKANLESFARIHNLTIPE